MAILGITDGQTSGAAVVAGGRLVSAINEERIVRIKMARGFPRRSIAEALRLAGVTAKDVTGVAVAQKDMEFRDEIAGWPGWFEAREDDADVHAAFFKVASRYGGLAASIPGLKSLYYQLRKPIFARRRARIAEILREEFGITAPVEFFDHHYAHATSAYFTSGFEKALVVTMDGGGDGNCSQVYAAEGGRLKLLNEVDSYDSLGNYYAYATALCGYKAKRHEGKITGLAARGTPVYRDLLGGMIAHENGRLVNKGRVLFNTALTRIRSRLPEGWTHQDLAASIQVVAEDVARGYVRHWAERTGLRDVALAGGLFANVRINEEIHLLPVVDRTFVHPGMSDEGLAVGAALAMEGERRLQRGETYTPAHLPDVYLGTDYGEREIADAVSGAGLQATHFRGTIEDEIGARLAQGKVVARFNGKMEYGPRALGNRTILYQPGDPSVNDWLNELLKRTEFMPFAPSSLDEAADDLYLDVAGGRDTARFMTITFHCKPWTRETCGGVVHVDGTARPQLVRKQDNPSYWSIIDAYRKRTAMPTVINTSFNIH
ncbi:MAG TPA: carbamoyltransferase C-terminal domain-containing protein, partial [Candidatus Polarisedimenticolaceae bacterium]|nr:carbamoyltransferase C-terminal domain-containing protein [Candidatus Polarisedimenticolaceae bacterium]